MTLKFYNNVTDGLQLKVLWNNSCVGGSWEKTGCVRFILNDIKNDKTVKTNFNAFFSMTVVSEKN